jgi:AmiR/NasT family two-component response regulator
MYWKAARLANELQQTLAARGKVEQATGILMAQHNCAAEHALHLLAASAQHNRLTIAEVAADLVERTSQAAP